MFRRPGSFTLVITRPGTTRFSVALCPVAPALLFAGGRAWGVTVDDRDLPLITVRSGTPRARPGGPEWGGLERVRGLTRHSWRADQIRGGRRRLLGPGRGQCAGGGGSGRSGWWR